LKLFSKRSKGSKYSFEKLSKKPFKKILNDWIKNPLMNVFNKSSKKTSPKKQLNMSSKKGSLIVSLSIIFVVSLLVLTVALNSVSMSTTRDALYKQMEENAIQVADIVSSEIASYSNIDGGIEEILDNYIYSLAYSIGIIDDITNEDLIKFAEESGVSEVNVIDLNGYVIHSNVEHNLGYKYPPNSLMGRVIYSTTPKVSTKVEQLVKSGGVKLPNGAIEIKLSANYMNRIKNNMSIERKLVELSGQKTIKHILTVDRNDSIVYDSRGKVASTLVLSQEGKTALQEYGIYSNEEHIEEDGITIYNMYVPLRNQYGTYEGFINVAFSLESVRNAASDILKRSILFGSIIFILILALTMGFFYYKIGNPLKLMMKYIANISQFDLRRNSDVDKLLKENNEIGNMAIELEKMRGNLTKILENIKGSSLELSEYTEVISKNSNETSISISEVSRAVEELALGSSEQAKESSRSVESLNELSKKIEDLVSLSKTMHGNTQDMGKANETSVESIHSIRESFKEIVSHFNTMSNKVDSLAKKSEAIDKIAQAIKSISEETNLLALNAAIEAARAGEHGRGFAVVADEIRKLSDETSKSAQNVGKIIAGVEKDIRSVKEEMSNSTEVIKTFDESTERSIEAFDRIKAIIEESISQINTLVENVYTVDSNKIEVISALESITAIIQQASASTEEVAASVEEQSSIVDGIAEMTEKLKDMAQGLENTIDSFKVD